MKLGNVTRVPEKGVRRGKDNYRPVSILPNMPIVFKDVSITKLLNFSINHFTNVVSGNVTVLSTT